MHRISLRGPWEISLSPVPPNLPTPQRLPATWTELFGDQAGTATFRRTFHRPTNLDPGEVVWLALTGCRGAGTVVLNGDKLGDMTVEKSSWRADITHKLMAKNKLHIELTYSPASDPQPGGLYDLVEIQIENCPLM